MMYLIKYTILSERKTSTVILDLENEPEYYDTPEGSQILRKKISTAENLALDSFSIGDITEV